jgi:hypothetical protein
MPLDPKTEVRTTVILDRKAAQAGMRAAKKAKISFSCLMRAGLKMATEQLSKRGPEAVLLD